MPRKRQRRPAAKPPEKRRRRRQNVEKSPPIRMANYNEVLMREHYIKISVNDRFDVNQLKEFQIKAVEIDLESQSLPFFKQYQGSLPSVSDYEDEGNRFPAYKEIPKRQLQYDDIMLRLRWFVYYLGEYLLSCRVHILRELAKALPADKAWDKRKENAWSNTA